MRVTDAPIPDVKRIQPVRHKDHRGHFSEVFSGRALQAAGLHAAMVQDNQSLSRARGTVRGLHFQVPPHAQAKLVRVVRGAILDVAVDLRVGSPSFGCHVAEVLDAESGAQLYIPEGFAHGFCTLEPDTEVIYKVSAYYAPSHDRGIRWNDPRLAIAWPAFAREELMSARDRGLPCLADLPATFAMAPGTHRPSAAGEVADAC